MTPRARAGHRTGAPALRAVAFALGALAARPVAAAPCPPTATLGGDAEAIAQVAAALQQLGVTTRTDQAAVLGSGAATRCPGVVAAVSLDGRGGISVAVREGAHRSEGRVVSDATLAAAWIDSWLRDDLAIAAATPPAEAPPGEVAPHPTAPRAETPAADATPSRAVLDRVSVSASLAQTWTFDGSTWSGMLVGGCARVGAFCLGGRASYASQHVVTGLTAATRQDAVALATARWSHELGSMWIAPEVGVGVGRVVTERRDPCPPQPPPACDPTDPNCMPPPPPTCVAPDGSGAVYVGDGFNTSTVGPRLAASLRVAVPLFAHVWLDGLASVSASPLAHAAAYAAGPNVAPDAPPAALALPGEPRAAFLVGVGLRVGVP